LRVLYTTGNSITDRKCIVAPVLNQQFRNFADKHVIFYDHYYGHQNSFGRDNYHRAYQSSS